MTSAKIEELWVNLTHSGHSEFEFIRIDAECIPELNIGLNSRLDRCLILELPTENDADIQSVIKENLALNFYRETNYIVVQLTDNSYQDLFNDLIVSIYQHIYLLSDTTEYTQALIYTFYKWSGFFDDKKTGRLQPDQIKGLIGELLFLRDFLLETPSSSINDAVLSWQGPYDKSRDFVTDSKDTEVKTIDTYKTDVIISSEYQLEPESGKTIELAVVSIEADVLNGLSLKTIVLELRDIIIGKLGDTAILFDALSQKGLSLRNLYEYDNLRFRPVNIVTYDCSRDGFPKLTHGTLPAELYQVSYHLRISMLNDFILQIKTL